MSFLLKNRRLARCLFLAALVAFVIQLPFLVLMNFAGIHSALGGAWALFYLPAIWLLDNIGLPTPRVSPLITIVEAAVIQEIILMLIISPFVAMYVRFGSRKNGV